MLTPKLMYYQIPLFYVDSLASAVFSCLQMSTAYGTGFQKKNQFVFRISPPYVNFRFHHLLANADN